MLTFTYRHHPNSWTSGPNQFDSPADIISAARQWASSRGGWEYETYDHKTLLKVFCDEPPSEALEIAQKHGSVINCQLGEYSGDPCCWFAPGTEPLDELAWAVTVLQDDAQSYDWLDAAGHPADPCDPDAWIERSIRDLNLRWGREILRRKRAATSSTSSLFKDWLRAGGVDPDSKIEHHRLARLRRRFESGKILITKPLPAGEMTDIAHELDVAPNTVFRWFRGEVTPNKFAREALRRIRPDLILPTD